MPYEVASPDRVAPTPPDTVFILVASAFQSLSVLLRPSVIVCRDDTVAIPRRVLSEVAAGGIAILALSELTPASLLRAILVAAKGRDLLDLGQHLRSRPDLTLPPEMIDAFLLDPSRLKALGDLRRALKLSERAARALVRGAGFQRAEHLLTRLRAEAWLWFGRRGIARKAYEPYLGIRNRWNFRRACLRAGIGPPWQVA